MTAAELTVWLGALAKDVKATKSACVRNKVPGCPIPFFGDVLNARVLTIGVNPSSTEFDPSRKWREASKVEDWQERMLNYFHQPAILPHEWFEPWSMCLEFLDISYADRSAAQLDISPRPTTAMFKNAKTNQPEFRAMVKHDVKWFFKLLGKLPQVQLLLVTGPIPRADGSKQQLADFIREHSGVHSCEWLEGQPLPKLVTPAHPQGIPVFVCPFEPGMDGLYAMVRQVHRNRELLRSLAADRNHSVPILPARLDWASAIGNFITNFGMLDLHVQDFLESLLSAEEFLKVKERPFYERVEVIKQRLGEADCAVPDKAKFEQFFHRLDPLRENRNHIAHGILRIGPAADEKTVIQTLSLPRDLAGSAAPDVRHLEFDEMQAELKTLNEMIEEFQHLAGLAKRASSGPS